MSWDRSRPIPEKYRCKGCGEKYAQVRGLCYACMRDQGVEASTRYEREQATRTRREAAVDKLRVEAALRPAYTVAVGGEEFLVVWDGELLDTEARA